MATRKKSVQKKSTAKKTARKKVAAKPAGLARKKTTSTGRKKSSNGIAKLVLDENLTISNVHELQERLLKSVKGKNRVELDGGKVDTVDTAGLQMLVAFILYCKQNSIQLQWLAKSRAIEQTSSLLGLSDVLEP